MRDFKRDSRPQGGRDFKRDDRPQTMFKTICSDCGKECEVPFKPNGSKPVFCRDCFQGKRRFEGPRHENFESKGPHQPPTDPHREQFIALSSKLDKILSLLVKEEPIKEIAEAIKEETVLTPKPKAKSPVVKKKKASKK